MHALRTSLVLLGAGAAGLACAQAFGLEGSIVVQAEGGPPACGIPAGNAACESCLATSCCDVAQACRENGACAAYESCAVPCLGDPACRARCAVAHGANLPEVAAFDQCLDKNCGNGDCGVTCGEEGVPINPAKADECANCIKQFACPQAQACGESLSCHLYGQCLLACGTPDCQGACKDEQGAGADLLYKVALSAAVCQTSCGAGATWSCVGAGRTFPAKSAQMTAELSWLQRVPDAGVLAKACPSNDLSCAAPSGTGLTTDGGVVSLSLPPQIVGLPGFQGYFDISSNPAALYPELSFLAAPVSERVDHLRVVAFAPGDLASYASDVSATLDPDHGHVFVIAQDCLLLPAPDVTVQIDHADAMTRTIYFSGMAPSASSLATDALGFALILNVPANQLLTVTLTPTATGRPSTKVTMFTRPGVLSYVQAFPNQ